MDNEDKEEYEVKAVEEAEVIEVEPEKPEPVKKEILEEPPPYEEKKGFFSQFPKIYWVADSLELFERGAYYGMLAVMAWHMEINLGISTVTIGLLFSLLLFFSYFWPLFASALAEKFGYRQVIMVAFGLLIFGYFLTSTLRAGNLALFVIAILFMGFGAGTFKPLISATIAHVTMERQRNLAYSLYYWFINFGAFVFPLILGFAFPAEESYYWIFVVSGILISVNVGITLLWYSNPIEPQRDLSVPQAFKKILPALQDKKFRTLLIIYAGFWFMYAVNHSFLPIYMKQFHRMPGWFTVQWLAIINPGTIIVVGPALGKFMEKYKSLNVMMVGIIIYCIGVLLTFGSNTEAFFVTGIIIYSIGEFIVHPGFIAYVSKIAPKDKVAIYMGAIFISTGVGIVIGPAIMSVWYLTFVENAYMPKLFGTLIVAVGFLTLASFILYNRWINKLAKEEDDTYVEDTSMWTKMTSAAVAFIFIPIVIGVGYAGGTDTYYGEEEGTAQGSTDWSKYEIVEAEPITFDGYFAENAGGIVANPIEEENIISITFTLTWTDEEDILGFTNQPDEFSLKVETPNGTFDEDGPVSNNPGGIGEIKIPIIFHPDKDPFAEGTGVYNITIVCGDCGDQESIGPLGLITQPDNGNDWEFLIDYKYYKK